MDVQRASAEAASFPLPAGTHFWGTSGLQADNLCRSTLRLWHRRLPHARLPPASRRFSLRRARRGAELRVRRSRDRGRRDGACNAAASSAARRGADATRQASHNPEEDNGVKLVDPSGAMLEVRAFSPRAVSGRARCPGSTSPAARRCPGKRTLLQS